MSEERTDPYEPLTDEDGDAEIDDTLFTAWSRKTQLEVRTHIPATVVSYDAATQLCTCTVDALMVLAARDGTMPEGAQSSIGDGADMSAVMRPITLEGVRVLWPRTSAGYLTLPLSLGDTGLLLVSDRALDHWHAKGIPVDPVSSALFDLGSSLFLPGLCHDGNVIAPAPAGDAAVLHGPMVLLGRDATELVALAAKVKSFVAAVLDAMVPSPTPDGGAAAIAAGKAFVASADADALIGAMTVKAK